MGLIEELSRIYWELNVNTIGTSWEHFEGNNNDSTKIEKTIAKFIYMVQVCSQKYKRLLLEIYFHI
jgi:hypothetical protein